MFQYEGLLPLLATQNLQIKEGGVYLKWRVEFLLRQGCKQYKVVSQKERDFLYIDRAISYTLKW